MKSLILFALSLSACHCSHTFVIGSTLFQIYEGAEPWDDLPEVMAALAKTEDTPYLLWATKVHLYPAYEALPVDDAVCYFSAESGEIFARTTKESAIDSCLAHEFAHRWVFLLPLQEPDVHGPVWKEKRDILQKQACGGNWMGAQRCEK